VGFFRWLGRVLVFFVLISLGLLFLSVRPVNKKWPSRTKHYRKTLSAFEEETREAPVCNDAPVRVGVGKASITPPVGTPLAGYGARKGKPSLGVHDSLFARALLVEAGRCRVCFLTLDALIVPSQVTDQILDSLRVHPGLSPREIVFSATHTHSGPGGWGRGPIQKMFAGNYDRRVVNMLVDSSVAAVRRAFAAVAPGAVAYGQFSASQYTANRLVGKAGTIDSVFTFVVAYRSGAPVAVLGSYAAHSTVLPAGNFLFSGDWPGAWCRYIEKRLGVLALYAAGGVGSHRPRGPGSGYAKARAIGQALAESVLVRVPELKPRRRITLRGLRVPLFPGTLQLRISQNFRLTSWLGRWLLKPGKAWLNGVLLDSLVILSAPADWSGELTNVLRRTADSLGLKLTVTSFNGGYIGYVVPDKYYSLNEYETRLMSFYGPHTATYLMDIFRRILRTLASGGGPAHVSVGEARELLWDRTDGACLALSG